MFNNRVFYFFILKLFETIDIKLIQLRIRIKSKWFKKTVYKEL